ncbi:MAG: molecular chaperone protein containing DnaJ domain [Rickettsiaceae bacterium]|jgi:molecular chaperone HscB|nr:molecular chaperone protein containing DnaJ domain [Rickettsiaceae bacterium]
MTNTTKSNCWSCSAEVSGSIFCPSCKKIQPSGPINHFIRLGMPIDFEIGAKNLEVAYFGLQRQLHPDLFVNKSDKEKSFSMQQTIDLNTAFETLKSPLKRAEYMLSLQGITVNSDNATVKPSQEILLESLETREQLENATTSDDLRTMSVSAAESRLQAIDEIKEYLAQEKLEDAAQSAIKLRYLEKLIQEIKTKGNSL